MRVEFSINSEREARIFSEFAIEYGKIRDAEKAENERQWNAQFGETAAPAADPAQTELPLTTAPADVTEPVKKERKPRQKKEKVIDAEPIAVDAPVQAEVTVDPAVDVDLPTPEPTPAPAPVAAAPAGPKAEDLANQTRDLAKVNFAGVKGVLAKFGVARFGELKPEQYPAYASALAAL